MSSDWEKTIEDYLTLKGWSYHHQRPARTAKGWRSTISGRKGFPDYVAGRDGRMVVIEAKTGYDKPSPDQQWWLDLFRAAGNEVYVFWPKNRSEMERVLA